MHPLRCAEPVSSPRVQVFAARWALIMPALSPPTRTANRRRSGATAAAMHPAKARDQWVSTLRSMPKVTAPIAVDGDGDGDGYAHLRLHFAGAVHRT
jgi:hypothetical protein